MRTHFKAWAKPYLDEHKKFVISPKDIKEKLNNNVSIIEVGSGKGQLLYKMALHHPEITFFGMERNITCAGFFAKKVDSLPYNNCFIIAEDFEKYHNDIPNESFDILMLSFPDPWPKKRHEKRRLVYSKTLELLVSKIKKGGYIRLKTDNDDLFEFAKISFSNLNTLTKISVLEDYKAYFPFDEMSEYEENFRKQGHKIHQLIYKKR